MADVPSNIDAEISSDGSGLGVDGVGGAQHLAAGLDNVVAFPDHGDNGARRHVLDEVVEEALVGQIGIVLLEVALGGGHHLAGSEHEAAFLESGDDFSNYSSLDSVGFDHDEGLFHDC